MVAVIDIEQLRFITESHRGVSEGESHDPSLFKDLRNRSAKTRGLSDHSPWSSSFPKWFDRENMHWSLCYSNCSNRCHVIGSVRVEDVLGNTEKYPPSKLEKKSEVRGKSQCAIRGVRFLTVARESTERRGEFCILACLLRRIDRRF